MAQTFTATATATTAEIAEDLAITEARSQALATFGANTTFVGVNNIFVKINDNQTYTATYTTQAESGTVPPDVTDADPTAGLLDQQDAINQEAETQALLTQQAEIVNAQNDQALEREAADLRIAAESASPVDTDPDGLLAQQEAIREAELAQLREAEGRTIFAPAPVQDNDATGGAGTNVAQNPTDANTGASAVRGLTNNAQNQSTLQTRISQPTAADWRVRLSLAPNATYLYRASNPGILAPLLPTNGVIFPYTPSIDTSYTANYDKTDLTHSNYRGYFYKSSSINDINIKGTFTAQDTLEAQYLLAVIHFFRSVTKMFYGQDPEAGTPPPLVYLSGFGQNQFNNHPCVVTNFTYNLPTDVDYIRATGFNNIGLNLSNRRTQSSGPTIGGSLGTVVAIIDRLKNAGLNNGSVGYISDAEQIAQMNKVSAATAQNSVNSTYVPTKMEISITLYPIQTRTQVSQQFSLKGFANGELLRKGFW